MADSIAETRRGNPPREGSQPPAGLSPPEGALGAIVLTLALLLPVWFLPAMEDSFALAKVTFLRVAFGLTLAALAWVFLKSHSSRSPLPAFVRFLVLGFVALNVLAFAFSSDPRRSLLGEYQHYQGFTTIMMYLAFFYVGARVFRTQAAVTLLLAAITLGGLPVAVYALAQYLNLDPIEWDFGSGRPWRVFSSFGQPTLLAAYLAMIIPLAVGLFSAVGRSGKVALVALISLFVVVLFLTISRAGYLAFLITVPLIFGPFLREVATPRRLPILIGALGAITALIIAVQPMATTAVDASDRLTSLRDLNDWSLQGRIGFWLVAGEITLDDPILGAGQDTYPALFAQHRDPDLPGLGRQPIQLVDPHNHYLALAASTGIPSLAVYVALVAGCLALALRGARDGPTWRRRALVPIMGALLAHVVTDVFTLEDVTTAWLFWLLMGAAVGIAYRGAEGAKVRPSHVDVPVRPQWSLSRRPLYATVATIAALAGLLIAALSALPLSADIVAAQAIRTAYSDDWPGAGRRYDQAAVLNPFESRYLIRAGDAYLQAAADDGFAVFWVNEARRRYEAADRRFVPEAVPRDLPAADKYVAEGKRGCPLNPFRPRRAGALSGKTVVLDPGHGGGESGATFSFADGLILKEKALTLDISLALKDLLRAEGATVYMTRCQDSYLSLKARAALANSLDPDLFVSIHLNGSENPRTDGTEVYYFVGDSRILARSFLGSLWQSLNPGLSLPNRGAHREAFTVLAYSRVPTVLTESVFLTNPLEAFTLREAASKEGSRRQAIVLGHFDGIINYFGGDDQARPASLFQDLGLW